MAIQERRGNFVDLDTSKLVQGEPFVTLDQVDGDYYAGIAIGPSNVIRFATWNNLVDIRTDCEQYRDEAEASKDAAADSESNSEAWAVGQRGGTPVPSTDVTYENNSKWYSEHAETYWNYIDAAVNLVTPQIDINWSTGQLEMSGSAWFFKINQTTGQLEWSVSAI